MNVWECDRRRTVDGCDAKAVGEGGAIGLRAIGWWFEPGLGPPDGPEHLLCPRHRPDPIPCLEAFMYPDSPPDPECSPCAGELEADKWQQIINESLGFKHRSWLEWLESHRKVTEHESP